jgi:hypothetical protein
VSLQRLLLFFQVSNPIQSNLLQSNPTQSNPHSIQSQAVCEQLKVQSQNDTVKLAEAKGLVYLKVGGDLGGGDLGDLGGDLGGVCVMG